MRNFFWHCMKTGSARRWRPVENARRTLNHDYAVRELVGPLDPVAQHSFKLQAGWKAADLGVAAFMLDAQGGTLQALALAACP